MTKAGKVAGRGQEEGQGAELFGRGPERFALDGLVAAVRAGESRVLVLHGPGGIGKTALLDHAETTAAGLRTLRTAGLAAETELSYAALHRLCAPLFDRMPKLPPPQRTALETVFGTRDGRPPERFLVALAVLGLLSDVSAEGPVLCLVDDAQWLDRASAQVLGFVARRLLAESVGLVLAARDHVVDLRGLPELEVAGLPEADARALLRSVTHGPFDPHVLDRIVAETRGNPLALRDLPHGRPVPRLAGGFALLSADRPDDPALRARIAALPRPARLLLLIAAAEPVGDPALVWQTADRLGVTPASALGAGIEGLLAFDVRVIFAHPHVRSSAYRSAPAEDRRRVHRVLAELTDEHTDPDRRAWHLAAAAPVPDESVAVALERAAGRARDRGGLAAAAAFRQRAVALTADPARRASRAAAAAEVSLRAGDLESASSLAGLAARDADGDFVRARAHLVRARLAVLDSARWPPPNDSGPAPDADFGPAGEGRPLRSVDRPDRGARSGPAGEAVSAMLAAARRIEPFDLDLAREAYLLAWGAAARTGHHLAAVSQAVPPPAAEPEPADLVLTGYARLVTGGPGEAVPMLRRAAAALAARPVAARWGWLAGGVGAALWDDGALRDTLGRAADGARAAGALADLPSSLVPLAVATAWTGDLGAAAAIAAEAGRVGKAAGVPVDPDARLLIAALRGDGAAAPGPAGLWTAAVLGNGLARYEQALDAARAAVASADPWVSRWALPELVEAAVRVGDSERARTARADLAEATKGCDTDWARGLAARSRALVSDGPAARLLYAEAVERLGRTRLRPELARAHLLYGEWLRRRRQRVEARAQLRTAYEMCSAIGMAGFAERARRELLATGETARRRTPEAATDGELTAQERQIALLVRDGMSNPEVGARLFLSPRTVEWHLRKVFAKLGIGSRRQLREALRP
ncbi:AAA family ATPase [Actinoplanes sp. NPDC051411]|uniref:helix-turn-helix transcriptional regulator n=1 Tax=Actinoplanes sp. NPDC051411 TaxID=3155522 RepID=UPI00342F7ABA